MDPQTQQTYTVKEGDTLSGIAQQFGLSDWSGITGYSSGDEHTIYPGEVLNIPTNNLISTSSKSRAKYNDNVFSLQNAMQQFGLGEIPGGSVSEETDLTTKYANDPILKSLDQMAMRSDESTKMLINSIKQKSLSNQAIYQQQATDLTKQYEDYKKGLQLLGVQTGSSEATPDLLMGHIQAAEGEKKTKVANVYKQIERINDEETMALMEAENARAQNDFRTLEANMKRIDEIKSEKLNALKEINSILSYEQDTAEMVAGDIYDALYKLNSEDQEAFLQAVSRKYKVPVMSLLSALQDEKKAREKDSKTGNSGTTFKLSNAIASVTPQFEAVKGSDGYVSVDNWKQARINWQKAGVSDSSFISNFKKYLNPISYGDVGFKAPSGGGGGSDNNDNLF